MSQYNKISKVDCCFFFKPINGGGKLMSNLGGREEFRSTSKRIPFYIFIYLLSNLHTQRESRAYNLETKSQHASLIEPARYPEFHFI